MDEAVRKSLKDRYTAAGHAMQSGVLHLMAVTDSHTPKHLRVGVNTAHADLASLAKLMLDKGVFTEEEYLTALAEGMEAEKARYEAEISRRTGNPVTLI